MADVKQTIQELFQFISYPTISAGDRDDNAFLECATWLAQKFVSTGMQQVKIYKTYSNPVVFAEYHVHPQLPTILFYGHYDVQPVDPLNAWHTQPFKAIVKGNYIYGRGASDDKGQLFIHIKAVERLLKEKGSLPVNIKFLIEGSEEIGSTGLKEFITSHKKLLHCNVAVLSDTKMASLNVPAISYSLRGSLNAEIFIQTSTKDLHSGTFGGCVPNAAIVLSEFISKLHNEHHRVAIPSFYDNVKLLPEEERKFIQTNGANDTSLLKDADTLQDWGEENYSMYERTTIRPSLSVTGFTSGFQGKGVKNIIPSQASVKINFRLVPHQKPEEAQQLFDEYIRAVLPGYGSFKTKYSSYANPVTISKNNLYIRAAVNAYEQIFKKKVRMIRSGGTIAAVDFFNSILKIPVVLMGFAQVNDNMHAPNERFYLPNFFRGVETCEQFIKNVARIHKTKN